MTQNNNQHQLILTSLAIKTALQIQSIAPKIIFGVSATSQEIILRTQPKYLRALAALLRNSTTLQATTLTDIVATDRPEQSCRFSVKYLFLSTRLNHRIVIEIFTNETTTVPSLAAPFLNKQRIFASAGWLEREVWDLFGIYFTEHGDLRRILTDYGFTGHPLRKDFPLTGFHELVYNDAEGRVTSEPVELAQEFRVFHI